MLSSSYSFVYYDSKTHLFVGHKQYIYIQAGVVADNAISALDKIARYRNRPELMPFIFRCLPLTADAEVHFDIYVYARRDAEK